MVAVAPAETKATIRCAGLREKRGKLELCDTILAKVSAEALDLGIEIICWKCGKVNTFE